MSLTSEQLDAIREMANAATDGPWSYDEERCTVYSTEEDVIHVGADGDHDNGRFIAAARDYVPALLSEVDRLTAANERMAADVAEAKNGHVDAIKAQELARTELAEANGLIAQTKMDDTFHFACCDTIPMKCPGCEIDGLANEAIEHERRSKKMQSHRQRDYSRTLGDVMECARVAVVAIESERDEALGELAIFKEEHGTALQGWAECRAELDKAKAKIAWLALKHDALVMCEQDGCTLSLAIFHCHGEDGNGHEDDGGGGECCTAPDIYLVQDNGIAIHRDHVPSALAATLPATSRELAELKLSVAKDLAAANGEVDEYEARLRVWKQEQDTVANVLTHTIGYSGDLGEGVRRLGVLLEQERGNVREAERVRDKYKSANERYVEDWRRLCGNVRERNHRLRRIHKALIEQYYGNGLVPSLRNIFEEMGGETHDEIECACELTKADAPVVEPASELSQDEWAGHNAGQCVRPNSHLAPSNSQDWELEQRPSRLAKLWHDAEGNPEHFLNLLIGEGYLTHGVLSPPFADLDWAGDRDRGVAQLLGNGGTVIAELDCGQLQDFLDMAEDTQMFLDGSSAVVTAKLDPAREELKAAELDVQLADIEQRVAAERAVLDAAKAWRNAFTDREPLDPDCYTADEIGLHEAVDGLYEVECGRWTQEEIDGAQQRAKERAERLAPLVHDPGPARAGAAWPAQPDRCNNHNHMDERCVLPLDHEPLCRFGCPCADHPANTVICRGTDCSEGHTYEPGCALEPTPKDRYPGAVCDSVNAHEGHAWGDPKHFCDGLPPAVAADKAVQPWQAMCCDKPATRGCPCGRVYCNECECDCEDWLVVVHEGHEGGYADCQVPECLELKARPDGAGQ